MQIYKTVNKLTGQWYIGKDERSRSYYLGSGRRLANAIKKYGKESFTKEILEECNSREELIEREIWWIEHTDAQHDKDSYNIGAGGIGGDWTPGFTEEEVKEIYKKRGYNGDNFKAAKEKFDALSEEEKKEVYRCQGEARCLGWYISKIETPNIEIYVKNLHTWCKEMGFDPGHASTISNPKSSRYGGQIHGYRIRRSDVEQLPLYDAKERKSNRFKLLNSSRKGLSWKIIDGKRKWIEKT